MNDRSTYGGHPGASPPVAAAALAAVAALPARVATARSLALVATLMTLAALAACGGAGTRDADADRAERRARRASERVTGAGGAGNTGGEAGGGAAVGASGGGATASGGAAGGGQAATSGPYAVILSPPSVVGERSYERSDVEFRQEVALRVDGAEIGRKVAQRKVHIEGHSHVLEVNPDGVAIVMEFTVDAASIEDDAGARELVARGDVVTIRRRGPTPRLELSSGTTAPEVLAALELVFTTTDPGASNDEVFGTRHPRNVGESWQPDRGAAARELSSAGKMSVDPGQISGSATLVSVDACGKGQRCMTVHAELQVDGFELPALPPSATMRDASSTIRIQQTHPLVPRSAPAAALLDMDVRTVIGMTQGAKDVEMETTIRSVQRASSEPR